MNSDNDNMMPLMMMMMNMGNSQNNNLLPVLIMTMMNKVILSSFRLRLNAPS